MEITNVHKLPEPFVNLTKKQFYSKGKADYSVTEIMSPPRIQRLVQKHWNEMKRDVTDNWWAMMGTALHQMLEHSVAEGHVNEERIYFKVDDVVLSGAVDLQQVDGNRVKIIDLKFTSAWALRQDKIEWQQQLNIYAWLLHKAKGNDIEGIQIMAVIRDWSRREAMVKPDYPQAPVQMVDIELWDFEKTEAYVNERIDLHRQAKVQADWGEELPLCTDEERWMRQTQYAVKKEGRKTAVRVFDTEEEANALLKETDKGFIEIRKGEAVRCTGNYCGVAQWCSQFKQSEEV
jgi:hypothetical protein